MQRVTPAEPFNPDPDARYRRTLAEAFPCDARQAVAFFDVSRPPRYGRWLALVLGLLVVLALSGCADAGAQEPQPTATALALVLGLLVVLALSGCADAGAQEPQPTATAQEIKRAAAGKWLCPGMHAEWISNTEVQCLKEKS